MPNKLCTCNTRGHVLLPLLAPLINSYKSMEMSQKVTTANLRLPSCPIELPMMAKSLVVSFLCLVLMSLALGAPKAKAAVTCSVVMRYLMPCVSYVSSGGSVPPDCCSGIRTLYGMAQTTEDRKAVCSCIKSTINGIPYTGVNIGLAASLPNKCGVNIPYQISPSTDCSKVQ